MQRQFTRIELMKGQGKIKKNKEPNEENLCMKALNMNLTSITCNKGRFVEEGSLLTFCNSKFGAYTIIWVIMYFVLRRN